MANELTVPAATRSTAIVIPAETAERAREYASHSKAENTKRAYRADFADFTEWCRAAGLEMLPATPQTVGLYLSDRAGTYKVATLQRRLTAISQAHRIAGHHLDTRHPAIRDVWAGIRRVHGTAQQQKAPAVMEDIRAMTALIPDSLKGARDRALLLIGFAGAFRRSELVSLTVEDIATGREGLTIMLRRSKTDQEGQGVKIAIPYGSNLDTCPVRAYAGWLEASGIVSGPVFRHVNAHGHIASRHLADKSVALIVKRYAAAAGMDPARYAGHSLRAGLATAAAQANVSERKIMDQTRHKSVAMVRRYIRDGDLFRDNAAGRVGL